MRGMALALVIVTMSALSVSFFSSFKASDSRKQLANVQADLQKSAQRSKRLEDSLQEAQEKYRQETLITKDLKENLAREESRNKILSDQLQRFQTAQNAQTPATQNQNSSNASSSSTFKGLKGFKSSKGNSSSSTNY